MALRAWQINGLALPVNEAIDLLLALGQARGICAGPAGLAYGDAAGDGSGRRAGSDSGAAA